jgi:hypothetical protein
MLVNFGWNTVGINGFWNGDDVERILFLAVTQPWRAVTEKLSDGGLCFGSLQAELRAGGDELTDTFGVQPRAFAGVPDQLNQTANATVADDLH